MVNIMGYSLLEICDVIQNGSQGGRYLEFYLKLIFIETMRKLKTFVKYDIIKHFAVKTHNFI